MKVHSYRTRTNEIVVPSSSRKCSRARTGKCVMGDISQPIENFSRANHKRDGLSEVCKECKKSMAVKHNEKKKEQKAWLNNFIIG